MIIIIYPSTQTTSGLVVPIYVYLSPPCPAINSIVKLYLYKVLENPTRANKLAPMPNDATAYLPT